MRILFVQNSASTYDEAKSEQIIATAEALLKRRMRPGAPVLKSPEALRRYLSVHLSAKDHEVFGLIYLDADYRLITLEELFRGTLNTAHTYPREVVKSALKHNATAVICFHNHPLGLAKPSTADELCTARLRQALSLVDVHLLDHWVVGGDSMASFRELGLL